MEVPITTSNEHQKRRIGACRKRTPNPFSLALPPVCPRVGFCGRDGIRVPLRGEKSARRAAVPQTCGQAVFLPCPVIGRSSPLGRGSKRVQVKAWVAQAPPMRLTPPRKARRHGGLRAFRKPGKNDSKTEGVHKERMPQSLQSPGLQGKSGWQTVMHRK